MTSSSSAAAAEVAQAFVRAVVQAFQAEVGNPASQLYQGEAGRLVLANSFVADGAFATTTTTDNNNNNGGNNNNPPVSSAVAVATPPPPLRLGLSLLGTWWFVAAAALSWLVAQ